MVNMKRRQTSGCMGIKPGQQAQPPRRRARRRAGVMYNFVTNPSVQYGTMLQSLKLSLAILQCYNIYNMVPQIVTNINHIVQCDFIL